MNCENLESIIIELLGQSPELCLVNRENQVYAIPVSSTKPFEKYLQADENMNLFVRCIVDDEIESEEVETIKQAVKLLK